MQLAIYIYITNMDDLGMPGSRLSRPTRPTHVGNVQSKSTMVWAPKTETNTTWKNMFLFQIKLISESMMIWGNDRSMVIRGFHSTLKSGWFCLPHSAIDGLHLGSVSGRMRQGCLGFAWTEKCQWRLAASFLIPFWFFGHLFMWYPDILQAPPG
jgi:hypothetical protein